MKLNRLLIITSVVLFTGCANEPNLLFPELKDILEPTETRFEERTDIWYKDQSNIRKDALRACFNHFESKANEIGGVYMAEFYENLFSKYPEIPDCMNARKGEILAMESSGDIHFKHQISQIEEDLNNPQNIAEINKLAQEVSEQLNQHEQKLETNDNLAKKITEQVLPDDE